MKSAAADTKNGGDEKTHILVTFTKQQKKHLIDYPLVKVSQGESILSIQRVHPLAFFFKTLVRLSIELFLIVSFLLLASTVFSSLFLPRPFLLNGFVAIIGITAMLSIELYAFFSWYYELYIITSKALIHKRFFHIAGPYSEVVLLDKVHQQEIDRFPPNLLYDYFRIENVTVRFHKLERDEPFIFVTPENSQEIEDVLQDITIQRSSQNSYVA